MAQADVYISTDDHCDQLIVEMPVRELHAVLAGRLPSLHRSAYRLLGNTADAEDAVQDALLAACKHLDQFRGESQISTWLTAIVFNSARMRLRYRRRHVHVSLDQHVGEEPRYLVSERLAGTGPSPEDECRDSELTGRVRQLITRLSPSLRRTLQLRDMEGLSIRETAEILGIPTGTVKARLARARKKLKQSMQKALQPIGRSQSTSRRINGRSPTPCASSVRACHQTWNSAPNGMRASLRSGAPPLIVASKALMTKGFTSLGMRKTG